MAKPEPDSSKAAPPDVVQQATSGPADTAPTNAATSASGDGESPGSLFERILEGAKPAFPWPAGEPFVAECTETRHPTLHGRIRIRWEGPGREPVELWAPTLHGQAFRQGDRVLVQAPHGSSEPVVTGVIDGFLPRPEPDRSPAAYLDVKQDETLQIRTQDGVPLVEIHRDENGPIVRLLQADTRIDLQGKLSITAAELELKAAKGSVRVEASDDVTLVGEVVHLN